MCSNQGIWLIPKDGASLLAETTAVIYAIFEIIHAKHLSGKYIQRNSTQVMLQIINKLVINVNASSI